MTQPITRRTPLADSFSRGLEIIRLQAQVQAKSILLLAKAILLIGVVSTGFWVWSSVEAQILLGAGRWILSWLVVDVLRADWSGVPVLTDAGPQRWPLVRIHGDPWHRAAVAETLAALKRAAAVCMALAVPASVLAYWGAYQRGRNAAASLLARGQKVVDECALGRLVRAAGGASRFVIGRVPLPRKALNRSILFLGAPQTGKSLSMKRWLRQVRDRGDLAIVFDKVGDVTAEFYDASRGDVLLNPLDARSPDWSPWSEMREIADAYRIAKSMIPSVQGENNFFHVGAQDLFATFLVRLLRLRERSLLGLLEATLVMPKQAKAELLRRSAAAKHYEGEHRSGHDVDATMAVYTQSLRFLRRTAGGRGDFSIRDFIADTIARLEKPEAAAIAEIRARFDGELAQLREARNHLAAGELRRAFRLVARIAVAYPLLPDGMAPPEPDDDFAAWWGVRREAIETHWRDQDAAMPDALAALEGAHAKATARLKKRGAPWLFIGSTQRQMHAVRPLLSLWLDAVADTILSLPDNRERRIWLMLDELQALQQLPSLQPLLTEGAKYGVCVCAGVQNMGQLRQSYGRDGAEVILSLFNTKAFFRLQEPDTARWAENAIGAAVKEHVHESIRLATSDTMDGASMSVTRATEPIVMAGEIMRLNDLHCYLMLPGDWPVGKIALRFDRRRDAPPAIAAALVPQRPEDTIYHALDALGWTPLPSGGDGDDPGVVARSVAAAPATEAVAGDKRAPESRRHDPASEDVAEPEASEARTPKDPPAGCDDRPPTAPRGSLAGPPRVTTAPHATGSSPARTEPARADSASAANARPAARPAGRDGQDDGATRPDRQPPPVQPELPHILQAPAAAASNIADARTAERIDRPRRPAVLDATSSEGGPALPRPPLSDLAKAALPTSAASPARAAAAHPAGRDPAPADPTGDARDHPVAHADAAAKRPTDDDDTAAVAASRTPPAPHWAAAGFDDGVGFARRRPAGAARLKRR